MSYPNTLIFVDLASDDPAAAGEFYAEVFGWENDPRPHGEFHRMVPGQNFLNPDGSQSEIGNLHLGIHNTKTRVPTLIHREWIRGGRAPRAETLACLF